MNSQRLQRITVEEGKCGGRPCIRGFRIRVTDILELLAAERCRSSGIENARVRDRNRAEVHVSEGRKKIFPPEPSRAIVSGFVEPVRVISVPLPVGLDCGNSPKTQGVCILRAYGSIYSLRIRNVELILN